MNRNNYRIIFSAAKNMFIAVAENVKSRTKTAGQSDGQKQTSTDDLQYFHQSWQVKSLVASMSLLISIAPVYANIQADPSADAINRPIIGVGTNSQGQNVPVVNIQTPQNGVSHNVYNQFDVLQPGTVLNNSRNGAASMIVGRVAANPFLQTGEARVILNEVNSSAASRFEGNLEIAGQRADVIIANPSGINIQGGGFINANKATLTTGKTQLNADGSIKQFLVDQGKINITSTASDLGLGGSGNNADFVDIYTKALELNAKIYANQTLNVVTGTNAISEDLSTINPNQIQKAINGYALDVKSLGGMYANNIYIIGTDKGLGVSNAGKIQSPQNLVINSAGQVFNTGEISNTNPQDSLLRINTSSGGDIVNNGAMITNGNLILSSGNNINLDRGRIEKHGADNKNIISISAEGDIKLFNSSNIQNYGLGGDFYANANNINVGNDVNIGVNGSTTLKALNELKVESARNIASIYDTSLYAGNTLSIKNSNLESINENLILETSKENSNVVLAGVGLNSGKNININSIGSISISQIRLDKNGETSKTKNINVKSQGDLNWKNTGNILPVLFGKLELRSNKSLDISGSNFKTNDSIQLQGKGIIIGGELNSKKEINITASEDDLNLGVNTNLISDMDVNVSALGGKLKAESLKINSIQGKISILGKKEMIISGSPINKSILEGTKGIIVGSIGPSDVDINNTRIVSSQGGVLITSEANNNIKNTKLTAKGNVELFSKKDLVLKNVNLNSQQHTALKSNKNVYIENDEVNSNSRARDLEQRPQLKSLGILSIGSGESQYIDIGQFTGGAILIEAGVGLNIKRRTKWNATGSELLEKDNNLKKINGSLTIQTNDSLIIDPKAYSLKATGDIELVSKNGALTLLGYGGSNGNGSEQVVQLETQRGGVKLEGIKIELQGSKITAQKDIKLVSSSGDILINGIKNNISNIVSKQKQKEITIELNYFKNKLKAESVKNKKDYDKYLEEKNKIMKHKYDVISEFGRGGNPDYINYRVDIADKNLEFLESKYSKINGPINTYEKIIRTIQGRLDYFNTPVSGYEHSGTNLNSEMGNIVLRSIKGVSISGSELNAKKGYIDIEAGGKLTEKYMPSTLIKGGKQPQKINAAIIMDGHTDFYDRGNENDENYHMRSFTSQTKLNGENGVNIRAVGKMDDDNLILQATSIRAAQGDVKIEANKNILLDVAVETTLDKDTNTEKKKSFMGAKKKKITTAWSKYIANPISVDISAKNINIESKEKNKDVSIDIYSGHFNAEGGKISIRSGGNINLYAVEEKLESKIDTTKKSSFNPIISLIKSKSKTNSTRSQLTELPAKLQADYIGTKSGFDTRLEGTEFQYLKGATIESGGKLELIAAKESITELLKKEKNSVVWQAMQDKGSITETASLPRFNGPTPPIFKADGGLIVQIPIGEKDQNKVELRDEILKLSNEKGNEYLKELVNRQDVDWQQVILTQKDWDYKQDGLSAAGAAIIAIALTVATGGAGGATLLATMGNAAMNSLLTQTTIALVNNKGNIGKTLKSLSSSSTIKGMATAAVTAGLLKGIATQLNLPINSTAFPDRLYVGLVNSTSSALVSTAFNGGDLSDNLKTALLSGFASAVHGGLAQKIGMELSLNNPTVLQYAIHKIAHAAAGCLAGALQKNCAAGAIGATLSEVFAEAIAGEKFDYTNTQLNQIKEASKALAATITAFAGYDVNIAINSADAALSNNWLGTQQKKQRDLEYIKANALGDVAIFAKYGGISYVQNQLTLGGVAAGIVAGAGSDIIGIAKAVLSPIDTFNGLKAIIADSEVRSQLTESVMSEINTKIKRIERSLNTGGLKEAAQLGYDIGTLTWEVVGVLTVAKGAATATAKLGSIGVNISKSIADMAKQTAKYKSPITHTIPVAQSQLIINNVKATPIVSFNDVILDPRLPAPSAGYNYKPTILNSPSTNHANSHLNGYKGELQLANQVAAIPNQVVLKYGDAIGRHGSDIISIDVTTGKVYLWDSKYRSANSALGVSPTFTTPTTRANAVEEAIHAVNGSNLPKNVKVQAIDNLNKGTFTTSTAATGNSKNSVIYRCVNHVCQ